MDFYSNQFINEFARKNLDKIPESPHLFVRCRRMMMIIKFVRLYKVNKT